jgi:hypothetical protein
LKCYRYPSTAIGGVMSLSAEASRHKDRKAPVWERLKMDCSIQGGNASNSERLVEGCKVKHVLTFVFGTSKGIEKLTGYRFFPLF